MFWDSLESATISINELAKIAGEDNVNVLTMRRALENMESAYNDTKDQLRQCNEAYHFES